MRLRHDANPDLYLKTVLGLIAALLAVLVLRSDQRSVRAQSEEYSDFHIEPGTTVIRTPEDGGQVQGKVVIDRRTGDVWGFPTSSSAPYPVDVTNDKPPVSKPIYLGRFDFSATRQRR
jgi:hypothetical protein